MGCPPLAEGVTQLKKKPTEEKRKQILFFSRIPYEHIICQMMIDSPHMKINTHPTAGNNHPSLACPMASFNAPISSPWKTPYTVSPSTRKNIAAFNITFFTLPNLTAPFVPGILPIFIPVAAEALLFKQVSSFIRAIKFFLASQKHTLPLYQKSFHTTLQEPYVPQSDNRAPPEKHRRPHPPEHAALLSVWR